MAARRTPDSVNFEQRAQTAIQLLIVGLIAWGGSSLVTVKEGLATLQATTSIVTAQTSKDISELQRGLDAVRTQAVNATTAATAATTAATTAAAVAATAVSTAAALAGSPQQKVKK